VEQLRRNDRADEVEDGGQTARRGGSARVPTAVPIAFAVSWKPLVKSKKSATATVRTSRSVCASGILRRDALQHVRHGLAAIEGILQETI
jgi:hypothetical protein